MRVSDPDHGLRIDKYLSMQQEDLSRSYIQKLIEEGRVTVNGNPVKCKDKV